MRFETLIGFFGSKVLDLAIQNHLLSRFESIALERFDLTVRFDLGAKRQRSNLQRIGCGGGEFGGLTNLRNRGAEPAAGYGMALRIDHRPQPQQLMPQELLFESHPSRRSS